MECPICLNNWHETEIIPRMLKCGHTFCHNCLLGLYKASTQELTCPFCFQIMNFQSKEEISTLVKNYTLISIITKSTEKEKQKLQDQIKNKRSVSDINLDQKQIRKQSIKNAYDKGYEGDKDEELKHNPNKGISQFQIDEINQKFLLSQYYIDVDNAHCHVHKDEKACFYQINQENGDIILNCQQCLNENLQKQQKLQFHCIPQLINEGRRCIKLSKEKIIHKIKYLEQVSSSLEEQMNKEENYLQDQAGLLLQEIKKIITKFEDQLREQINIYQQKKKQRFDNFMKELDHEQDVLINQSDILENIENLTEFEIMAMLPKLQQINESLNNKIKFEDKNQFIQLQIQNEQILSMLQASFQSSIDSCLNIQDNIQLSEFIDLDQHLNKQNKWICIYCNEWNKNKMNECQNCQNIRNVFSYSFLQKDIQLNDDKYKEIEKKIVGEIEKKYVENCHTWYAISMDWINQWKSFVNSTSNQLPGPIYNVKLYEQCEQIQINDILQLRKGLIRNKNYKMANEQVWNFFYSIYGGGPSIIRKEKDIYSEQGIIQKFEWNQYKQLIHNKNDNLNYKFNKDLSYNDLNKPQKEFGNQIGKLVNTMNKKEIEKRNKRQPISQQKTYQDQVQNKEQRVRNGSQRRNLFDQRKREGYSQSRSKEIVPQENKQLNEKIVPNIKQRIPQVNLSNDEDSNELQINNEEKIQDAQNSHNFDFQIEEGSLQLNQVEKNYSQVEHFKSQNLKLKSDMNTQINSQKQLQQIGQNNQDQGNNLFNQVINQVENMLFRKK